MSDAPSPLTDIPSRTSLAVPDRVAALFSDQDVRTLLTLRRTLHRHPELSNAEHETSARLVAVIESLGITDIRRVAGTGIVARIPGRDVHAPVVAVRGDIDALPITERTGLSFASTRTGRR